VLVSIPKPAGLDTTETFTNTPIMELSPEGRRYRVGRSPGKQRLTVDKAKGRGAVRHHHFGAKKVGVVKGGEKECERDRSSLTGSSPVLPARRSGKGRFRAENVFAGDRRLPILEDLMAARYAAMQSPQPRSGLESSLASRVRLTRPESGRPS